MGGEKQWKCVLYMWYKLINANGAKCGVVEWVKRNALKWFGHVKSMSSEEFVKVCASESEGPNRRGRPFGGWKDRVEEYMEGVLKQARRKCWDTKRGQLLLCPPSGRTFPMGVRRQTFRQIDRYTGQWRCHGQPVETCMKQVITCTKVKVSRRI